MKRIVLFLATNLAVMLVLSVVLKLLGLDQAMYSQTRHFLRRPSRVLGGRRLHRLDHLAPDVEADGEMVDRRPRDRAAVERSRKRGLSRRCASSPRRPGSRCRKSPSTKARPNAFATGAFKNSALVAVSTGLLQSMNKEEVEAVLGARGRARRQRRHGDADADPGRGQYVRRLLRADHRHDRRQDGVPHRARHRPRLLHHGDRRARSCWGSSLR